MSVSRLKKKTTESHQPSGIMYRDPTALTDCQNACIGRMGMTIQMEQNSYLLQHSEVGAMLKLYIKKVVQQKKDFKKVADKFFRRPACLIENEVREYINSRHGVPFTKKDCSLYYKDLSLESDLNKLNKQYHPDGDAIASTSMMTPTTVSSSFLSIITSKTTLPTPEPVMNPEPTLSETLFGYVQLIMHKACFANVKQYDLLYDTAYVEMMKIVEDAIEITVVEIKEDIATLLFNTYQLFELNILEKERIAAELAWERRMRKKQKKTLRRLDNFKGYERPQTPKGEISEHPSYLLPQPRPCECHPQFNYNRYPKDRFGIYIPIDMKFNCGNAIDYTQEFY